MKYLLFLLLSFCLCACGRNAANNSNANINANTNANGKTAASSPNHIPTPETVSNDFDSALKEFIGKRYKGWQLQGIDREFSDCDSSAPCEIHLTKGKEDKVISIIAKKFQKADGTFYWVVYETPKLDLIRNKIQHERDSAVEYTKENLDHDDCEAVIQEMADSSRSDEYEGYDPE